MRQHLLIDADDTLWESSIYFERAFEEFCDLLNHPTLSRRQIRDVLDEIELTNIQIYGYGAANFGRNLLECFKRLHERELACSEIEAVREIVRRIHDHPVVILEGVPPTLEYLAQRHDLFLLTKGDVQEQQRKINSSGLATLFRAIFIVKEKDLPTYRQLVREHWLVTENAWMIGNSPKSDINPALQAGLGAVYVPHDYTWHLERHELVADGRLHIVSRFSDLRQLF
ncbi:MAG: HAD hydrolase-like protein [Bryobacteraceae bacterium]|nr:HAD hydrolase-like protein [Bryobacteraceae bacterium]MDW8378529.1 HAD hydrolase-like protein [Bryobacterales bacterium]